MQRSSEDLFTVPADIKIGSFQLRRPAGEQFISGLGDTMYEALSAAALNRGELEGYLRTRARAGLTDGDTPSFRAFLQRRIDGSGDRLLLDSVATLNSALNSYVMDEAQELSFVHNIEIDFQTPLGKRRGQGGLSALGALRETERDAIVWQLRGYVAEQDGKGANAGLIYRRAAHLGTDALFGGNVFVDFEKHGDSGETFLRWSLGGEYRNAYFDLTANRYFAISDAVVSGGETYYSAEGIDAELNVNLHSRASGALSGALSGGLGYYNWEGIQGDKDDEGLRYHLRFLPSGNDLQLELQFDVPEEGDEEWGGRVAYRHVIGAAKRGDGGGGKLGGAGQDFDARAHFFDAARREYAQRIRRLEGAGGNVIRVSALAGMAVIAATEPGAAAAVLTTVTVGGEVENYSREVTLSIAIQADSMLQLAAGNDWGIIGYQDSTLHITDASEILSLAIGTVFVSRRSGALTLHSPDATVALLGTRLLFEVPGGTGRSTVHVYEGQVSIQAASFAELPKLELPQGGTLAAPAALLTVLGNLPAPAATVAADAVVSDGSRMLKLDCGSADGRANQRFIDDGFEGCEGDMLVGGLDDDETVVIISQGETVTLTGSDGNASVSFASAAADSTVKWAAYPFSPDGAALAVGDDEVEVSYGVGVEPVAATVMVAGGSTVEFRVHAPAALAAAARTVTALVRHGGVSGIGASEVLCSETDKSHVAGQTEGQLAVVALCGTMIVEAAGNPARLIAGRITSTVTRAYDFDNGRETFRFELTPAGGALVLANSTGTQATVSLISEQVAGEAYDETTYTLVARPPADLEGLGLAAVSLVLTTRIYKEFSANAAGVEAGKPVVFRTELDGGSDTDEYPVLTVQFVALGTITHNGTDYPTFNGEAVGDFDGDSGSFAVDLPAAGAGEERKFVTIRIDEAFDDETAITVSLAAEDDFEGITATVTAVITLQARHPGAVTAGQHGYAAPLLTANGFRVFKRENGNRIYTVGAAGNALAGGVSLSGLDDAGAYGFARTHNGPGDVAPTDPAGWDDNNGDGVPYVLSLAAVGGLPLAGEHTVEIGISDDHTDSGGAVLTLSVRLEDDIALAGDTTADENVGIGFETLYGEAATLTVTLSGGGGDYDFSLGGSGNALGLVSGRGSVAVLTLSSAVTTSLTRNLTVMPRGAWATGFDALTIPINAVVFSIFAAASQPAAVRVFRTELDEELPLATVAFAGAQGDVSYAVTYNGASSFSGLNVSTDEERATVTLTAPINDEETVTISIVATDAGEDEDNADDDIVVTVAVTVEARHPGALMGKFEYKSPITVLNNYRVYKYSLPINLLAQALQITISDLDNEGDLSGLGSSADYNASISSGDDIAFSFNSGTGVYNLRFKPAAAGLYLATITIDDDHSGNGDLRFTVSIRLEDEVAVAGDSTADNNTIRFEAGLGEPATLTITLSGGGGLYDFELGSGDTALSLHSSSGSVAVLLVESTAVKQFTRDLTITPTGAWADEFSALNLTITVLAAEPFESADIRNTPVTVFTVLDHNQPIILWNFNNEIGNITYELTDSSSDTSFNANTQIRGVDLLVMQGNAVPVSADINVTIVATDEADRKVTVRLTVQARDPGPIQVDTQIVINDFNRDSLTDDEVIGRFENIRFLGYSVSGSAPFIEFDSASSEVRFEDSTPERSSIFELVSSGTNIVVRWIGHRRNPVVRPACSDPYKAIVRFTSSHPRVQPVTAELEFNRFTGC